MSDLATFERNTLRSISEIEKRAKLAESLGPDYRLSMSVEQALSFCLTARAVLAQQSLSEALKKAVKWQWAVFWFAMGVLMAGLR